MSNVHSLYFLFLVIYDQRKYPEKSENITGLDQCLQNRFLLFVNPFGLISVFGLTALLIHEIIQHAFFGFHCQFIQGQEELVFRNRSVWPILILLNVFTDLERTLFYCSHLYHFIKKRGCTIYEAKIKTLISCAILIRKKQVFS